MLIINHVFYPGCHLKNNIYFKGNNVIMICRLPKEASAFHIQPRAVWGGCSSDGRAGCLLIAGSVVRSLAYMSPHAKVSFESQVAPDGMLAPCMAVCVIKKQYKVLRTTKVDLPFNLQ